MDKEPLYQSFIFQLDNPDLHWTFELFGNKAIRGRVQSYSLDVNGFTITVVVLSDNGDVVEIPWANVQYVIHPVKKES